MKSCWLLTPLLFYLTHVKSSTVIQVDRPRGVSLTKKVLYDSSRDFTCLDGRKTIAFKFVNDDYCDCDDGSDEPGTSACPNGSFHCTNAGYRPMNIPSSRVNDGICDCCDGSDEWSRPTTCSNSCIELRRVEMEEHRLRMEEANQGYILRQEFVKTGQAKKAERLEQIKELEARIAELKAAETSLKASKEEVEALESVAVDEHNKVVAEQKAKAAHEADQKRGNEAFSEMDGDRDASLTVKEVLSHPELDPEKSDGSFTEEEAQNLLQSESVDLSQFMDSVWPAINETFQTNLQPPIEELEEPPTPEQVSGETGGDADRELLDEVHPAEERPTSSEDYEDEDRYGDEDEEEDEGEKDDYDEDSDDDDEQKKATEPPPAGDGGVPYDEVTKALVDRANEARNKYNANQDQIKETEKMMDTLSNEAAMDFGPDEAFQVLQSQCFEMNTMEYKYKLCPFDKTTQGPKSGGSETVLGRWGSWSGPAGDLHSRMKYENGVVCWNGPARSTEVRIRCGVEHKLISVDEPSRCAYLFEFATPCACAQVLDHESIMPRDEL